MLIDIRSDILSLESNILLPELNLEISCRTFLTPELAKMTFVMKILSSTSTCCLLKIWILFLWVEKLQIKQSTRWSICSGESAFLQNFIGISAKRKISFISTVEMLDNLECWRLWFYWSGKTKSSNASWASDSIQIHPSVCLFSCFSRSVHHIKEKRLRLKKQFSYPIQGISR